MKDVPKSKPKAKSQQTPKNAKVAVQESTRSSHEKFIEEARKAERGTIQAFETGLERIK